MNEHLWLIESMAFNRISAALASSIKQYQIEGRSLFNASHDRATGADKPEIIDNKAYIYISGPLVNDVGWWEWLENYTRYEAIILMSEMAEKDSDVEEVIYVFDTPGGLVDGVERCAHSIKSLSKPTTALVKNGAYSAGYWLASQCDKIVADVPTSGVGSVGTVIEFLDPTEMYANIGLKRHTFVSDGAENKRPDPNTKEGAAVYQKIVNTVNKSFLGAISSGRDVTQEYILENFGRGGILFAHDALNVKMIDEISVNPLASGSHGTNEIISTKGIKMAETTYEQLKAEQPELFKQIKSEGVSEERDRVMSWLEFNDVDAEAVKTGIESNNEISKSEIISLTRRGVELSMVKDEAKSSVDPIDTKSSQDIPKPKGDEKTDEQEADDILAAAGFKVGA